jgi:tetratricopeptide (TPR) repeat protein
VARRSGTLIALILSACASGAAPRDREEALNLYRMGEYPAAIDALTSALETRPDAELFYRRACARLRWVERNGFDGAAVDLALKDFDRSLELWPADGAVTYGRAMAYALAGRYREAAQDLLVCIRSGDAPLARKAHLKLAKIFDEKFEGMSEAARTHLERYAQLGGADPRALRRRDELRSAAPPIRDDEDERKAAALFELSESLMREGQLEPSILCLEELLKKFPGTDTARLRATPALVDLVKKGKAQ